MPANAYLNASGIGFAAHSVMIKLMYIPSVILTCVGLLLIVLQLTHVLKRNNCVVTSTEPCDAPAWVIVIFVAEIFLGLIFAFFVRSTSVQIDTIHRMVHVSHGRHMFCGLLGQSSSVSFDEITGVDVQEIWWARQNRDCGMKVPWCRLTLRRSNALPDQAIPIDFVLGPVEAHDQAQAWYALLSHVGCPNVVIASNLAGGKHAA